MIERDRLRRPTDRALVGGVCAGIADYLDVEPLVVRVFFIVVAVASGIGLIIYPLAWALIPAGAAVALDHGRRPWRSRLSAGREALGIILLVGAAVFALRRAGLWLGDPVIGPLVVASCGVALILRAAGAGDWGTGLGVILVLSAAVLFLDQTGTLSQSGHAIGAITVVGLAFALVFGPWLARMARSLSSERSARIRSQERADLAAHLHDSVLQTLALIQRRAEDPREVAGLARRQERELRHWLWQRGNAPAALTLEAALGQAAADVEDLYKVRIEAVVVGDCPLDERLLAIVSAAREAMCNAAKFAGEQQIDLYAEVGADAVQVFVRDRGAGFDPAAIPEDRRGVRHSILERVRQHGGRAEIRSAPGQGTEIELVTERGAP